MVVVKTKLQEAKKDAETMDVGSRSNVFRACRNG